MGELVLEVVMRGNGRHGARTGMRTRLKALLRSGFVIAVAVVTALTIGPTLRVVVIAGAAGAAPRQEAPVPPPDAQPLVEGLANAEPEPDPVATADIAPGAEVMVVGTPSPDGYLLEVASAESNWRPQTLALLSFGPIDTRAWVGYECVTGDGDYVVAVVAPWEASNRPVLRDRGAVAFGVEIRTGKVTRLLDGVALKHFNPRCGDGSAAGLVRHLGHDQERSEVLVVDAATGELRVDTELDGQVIGVVPSDGDTYVFRDLSVARLEGDHEVDAVDTGGQPYMVEASPGGVSFLAADGEKAKVQRLASGEIATLGTYPLGEVKLHEGLGGDVTAVVRGASPGDRADGLRWLRTDAGTPLPDAVSTRASTLLASAEDSPNELAATPSVQPTEAVTTRTGDVLVERPRAQVDMSLPQEVLDYQPSAVETSEIAGATAANIDNPTCAVPRNNPRQMAPQASPDQVRWAIEQSVARNRNYTRPAGYLNQGWSAYSPAADFPVDDLDGPTRTVPASVAWATFVQESNWKQASRRSLAGASANPTIASYYGAPWNDPLSMIDYDEADCGYGLAQVTDGMRDDDSERTVLEEDKIALDYFANASAGVQILAQKWNEVTRNDLTVNNGDAKYLENWYAAVWVYNTGWNPPDGRGNYGLGWTNNPRNSDYPPDRDPFLRFDLDDSRTPSDWPYQERVFGWMENPLWKLGSPSIRFYPRPQGDAQLKLPDINAMCTDGNHCDPNDEPGPTAYCQDAERHCWWHFDIDFAGCGTTEACALSVPALPSNSEPGGDDNWPPNCSEPPPEATGVPGVVLIDDLAAGTPNIEGCGPAQSMGTFRETFGRDVSGAPLAEIDWHQLGTGFGGHTWFTDNVHPGDTAHTTVGRWTPNTPLQGRYRVWVHVPTAGATSANAIYSISTGFGVFKATLDQGTYEDLDNAWAVLGMYDFWGNNTYVELTNANGEPAGTTTMGFDAIAFVPQPGGPQQTSTLMPGGASWSYRDSGSVPSGWANPDYDDSAWARGYAPLGANAAGLRTTVNRLSPAHVTDLYRRTFQIDTLDDVWGLNLSVRYDDAVVVWLNGQPIYTAGLPTSPSPPDPNTLALACRQAPAQDTPDIVSIPASTTQIHEGANVIAVEVHQCASASDDTVFDLSIDGVTAPANEGLELDGVYSIEGEDRVAGVHLSFYPQANVDQYLLYQIDYELGESATPLINNIIPGANPLDPRGKLTVAANGVFERSLLREYYLVTVFNDRGASAPSQALRLMVLPNATREPDHSGPNIAYGVAARAAAPPAEALTAPRLQIATAAEEILPEAGQASRFLGPVLALGAVAYEFYRTSNIQVEVRIPTQVLNVPMVFGDSNFRPTEVQVTELADELQTRMMGPESAMPITRAQLETISRQCLLAGGRRGSLNECATVPILISGENDRESTNFYWDTILGEPQLAVLSRDYGRTTGKQEVVSPTWKDSYDTCKNKPTGVDCDEYPFYATAQNNGASPPVYLRQVNGLQNQHVGSVLNAMYGDTRCAVQLPSAVLAPDGGRFLVLPMPEEVTTVPTMYICGPPAPTK